MRVFTILPLRHWRDAAPAAQAAEAAGFDAVMSVELRHDPFIHYPRSAGNRAFEKPLALCEEHGFRPQIAQEASHWLTILRLIGAGLGVSIAPACVRQIASAEVRCIPLATGKPKSLSTIELATLEGESRPIVTHFARIVHEVAETAH